MKKILFGTTALLAAGAFAPTAQAADPIKLNVGGFMNYWMAAADQDGDYAGNVNSFDVQGNSEIHFIGETTLDNGMTVGLQVELEAGSNNNGDDIIDESYMYVSGKYGQLILGSHDDAASLSAVMAPSVSVLGTAGDGSDLQNILPYVVNSLEVAQTNLDDANKLTYFTPRMYGLQLGLSFTPSNNDAGDDANSGVTNSETVAKATSWDQAWTAALSYEGEYAGVGIAAAATYTIMDDNTVTAIEDNEIQNIGAGLNLSYQGFTVGGGYMRQIANMYTSSAAADGTAWNVGASYEEGPYGVSFTYFNSSVRGDDVVGGTVAATEGNDEVSTYQLAGTYKLGAGVDLFAELDFVDAENEGKGVANNGRNGNEGAFGGAVGLALSF